MFKRRREKAVNVTAKCAKEQITDVIAATALTVDPEQPRSQCLSSYRPLERSFYPGGGKMRDTGNEVGSNAEEGRKAEGDNWFIVAPRARQQ